MRTLFRHGRLRILACAVLGAALLIASSQYLSHFHVPQVAAAHADALDQSGADHCSLCLQFDRLPAPPAPLEAPNAWFFLVATLEAERLERLALDLPHLWPPSRGPPPRTC
jgi:hypothetical protein